MARVLLRDAPVVILDEATAYADPDNEAQIQEGLSRLASGKTVLVIAHRLKTVEGADKIVVLDQGRVVSEGTHEELLDACPTYRAMVDAGRARSRWALTSIADSDVADAAGMEEKDER